MKSELKRCDLIIKKSPLHGYGVYANQDILKDEIIEECHTIITRDKFFELQPYYFKAGSEGYALALGNGSLYNHGELVNANAVFWYAAENRLVIFKANRFIKKGEEILVYYGPNWFTERKIPIKTSKKLALKQKFLTFLPFLLRFTIIALLLFLFIKAI